MEVSCYEQDQIYYLLKMNSFGDMVPSFYLFSFRNLPSY